MSLLPSTISPLKILFVSTPVGPLGSGLGGGVELTLLNMALALQGRGHHLQVLAPQGSQLPAPISIVPMAGASQIPAQNQSRDTPVTMPANPVLGNLWDYARILQSQYDIIVNFAYDWLPFFLTPFFSTPVAHLVSMGSLSEAMDGAIAHVAHQFPGRIAVYTHTQAETFPFAEYCVPLGSGLDLSLYQFCPHPGPELCWLGRIAPEKALEDAVAAAQATQTPLKILGQIQDAAYWQQIQQDFPDAPMTYLGFLPTQEMQSILRQCRALLITSRWVEAFGNVVIEALACGVPVIAYARGGPAEIVRDGITGWLVEPDSVSGLISAIEKLDRLDRQVSRQQAEAEYSLSAYGERIEQWLVRILMPASPSRPL